jgi:histidinol-phosphate phosphatase family protein
VKYRSLFLDRDGVINERRPGDYVSRWTDFQFSPGVLDALNQCAAHFQHIFIVTNQQGIGKGLMCEAQLEDIHQRMLTEIQAAGGRIDGIYSCPDLASTPNNCRKPAPGLALHAQRDFPMIQFQESIMVGDSIADIEFGQNLGMCTVLIEGKNDESKALEMAVAGGLRIDWRFPSLWHFVLHLTEIRSL